MKRLYERHRPSTIDQVIGQARAVATARHCIERGNVGGSAFWITGPSGTGKTTIARILAAAIAEPEYIEETTGRDIDRGALDRIACDCRLHATGKGGRVWIINEAHGLSKAAIERMLDLLESLSDHACVIFTTTWDGQDGLLESQIDSKPLLSRCTQVKLTNQGLAKAAAPRLQAIAKAEGLDGKPVESYVRLMQEHGNNIRACLVAIDAGEMLDTD